VYYGARYYDPTIGRFISADSIVPSAVNPQALNRYAHVLNNPLKYADPTGHKACGGPEDADCDKPSESPERSVLRLIMEPKPWETDLAKELFRFIDRHPGYNAVLDPRLDLDQLSYVIGEHATWMLSEAQESGTIAEDIAKYMDSIGSFIIGTTVSSGSTSGSPGAVLNPENNHWLPQQADLKARFKSAGLDNDEYTEVMDRNQHKEIDGKEGGEAWENSVNRQWEKFFKDYPDATNSDILDQLGKLKAYFGK
jgi:hypothetical protein